MGELPGTVIVPSLCHDDTCSLDKENVFIEDTSPAVAHVTCHPRVEFKRSYSESSKDFRRVRDNNNQQSKEERRQQRMTISEDPRRISLEVEHVTIGEVTPTVYVKDRNDIVDESIQLSESVLKRSMSISNSRLQRKISKRLASAQEDEAPVVPEELPSFLRRNRSSSSVDKSSPPPDLKLLATSGLKPEDIAAFGTLYVQRLENRMRNIEALKELEKQHNISCRERLKYALDTHEQLASGLNEIKRQLQECTDKYRLCSEALGLGGEVLREGGICLKF
eukprot:sb/3467950/